MNFEQYCVSLTATVDRPWLIKDALVQVLDLNIGVWFKALVKESDKEKNQVKLQYTELSKSQETKTFGQYHLHE